VRLLPVGKTFEAWEPDRCAIRAKTQRALQTLEWTDRTAVLAICPARAVPARVI
jgi:hypothetical protein